MPNQTYVEITDAVIAPYAPWSTRKAVRFRNNVAAVCVKPLVNTAAAVSGSSSSTSFETVATLRFKVPDYLVGPGGTHLELELSIVVTGTEEPQGGDGRLKVGSDVGTPISDSAFKQAVSLEWQPTPGDVVDVELQARVGNALNSIDVTWAKHESGQIYQLR